MRTESKLIFYECLIVAGVLIIILPVVFVGVYPEENVTRTLLLELDLNMDETNLEQLYQEGYVIHMKIKSDRYTDYMTKPIGELLENNIILIPIIDNSTQHDDGGDFRVDVWINNYDNHFLKALYPVSRNATYDTVDITDIVDHAVADTNKERDEEQYDES